jgi:hypothetical protein
MDALKKTPFSVCECGITEAVRYLSGERAIVLDCTDQKVDGPLPLELLIRPAEQSDELGDSGFLME